jgi:hypothetical protein
MNAHQLLKQAEMLESYIKTGECGRKDWGLCANVLIENADLDYWDDAFLTWPSFSGSLAYPIEGDSTAYHANDRKHNRRTKYGKLRLSLAKHCLEYVMNELKEVV